MNSNKKNKMGGVVFMTPSIMNKTKQTAIVISSNLRKIVYKKQKSGFRLEEITILKKHLYHK